MTACTSSERAAGSGPAAEVIVVMGVSGCGKSTIATALADRADLRCIDADDLHPQSNIDKMSSGVALTDEDRFPWLERIREELDATVAAGRDVVLACSALKRIYRDVLRTSTATVRFVHLRVTKEDLLKRVSGRGDHFFPVDLLDSQFATLEEPGPDEDCLTVAATLPVAAIVDEVLTAVRR